MPQAWQVVLRVGKSEATDALRIALDTVPTDGDARSEFFVQWRGRTLADLEKIFQEGSPPVRRFREIEFSPRRLSGDEDRDDVLRRETCLSGCAVARHLLQMILDRLAQLPEAPATATVGTATEAANNAAAAEADAAAAQEQTQAREHEAAAAETAPAAGDAPEAGESEPEAPARVAPAAARAGQPKAARAGKSSKLVFAPPEPEPEPEPEAEVEAEAEPEPEPEPARVVAPPARPAPRAPVAAPSPARPMRPRTPARAGPVSSAMKPEGKTMQGKSVTASTHASSVAGNGRSHKLAASVRSSLGRFLAACEKGDPNAGSVLSARLFADLMVLGEDPQFRAAFEEVLAQSATDGSEGAAHEAAANAEALAAVAPAALWSAVVAIGRLADPRFDSMKPAA